MSLLRGKHRHHILVKTAAGRGTKASPALAEARRFLADFAGKSVRPRVMVDVDPTSML